MLPKFFGQYLLEKGVLDAQQLVESIKFQKSKVRKLGEIAVQQGFLTEAQSQKINDLQRKTDRMFGELAISEGLLNETQMKEILTIQQNSHIYLGAAIVHLGFMDQEALDKELSNFKLEQSEVQDTIVSVPDSVKEPKVVTVSVDLTCKLVRRTALVPTKVAPVTITSETIPNRFVVVSMDLSGDFCGTYVLNLSREIALELARKVLKDETIPADDEETLIDTAKEFANVVVGNIVAKLLELGKRVEIHPPSAIKDPLTVPARQEAVVVSMVTPIGDMDTILVQGK